jgi:hypothetical protein
MFKIFIQYAEDGNKEIGRLLILFASLDKLILYLAQNS